MDARLETAVASVTVFPDRARVISSGEIELKAGAHRLIVDHLPLALETESVRVTGRGKARVRISSVDVVKSFYEQAPAEKVTKLEQRLDELADEDRSLTDEISVLDGQLQHLAGLRQATEQYAKGLARGRVTVDDQAQLSSFLGEQDRQLRKAKLEVEQQQRLLKRQIEKVELELAQLRAARPRRRFQALVDLETFADGAIILMISYVVGKAGWIPLYDIKYSQTEDGHTLDVTAIAQISQETGQDWIGVDLSVSTARPALSQQSPELKPWYLSVYQPPIQRQRLAAVPAAQPAAAEPDAEQVALESRTIGSSMKYLEAEVAVAEVRESGTVITYSVADKADIPGDGSPHKTTVSQFRLEPELDYLAVPGHTDAVFRRCKVSNAGPGPFLSGPVSLFVDDEFIGKTRIEYVPVGEEIELLLGAEERIVVERELTRREVDKARLRDRRQLKYGYKIELHNLLDREANIEVHDQIPVARHEDIQVKLNRVTPDPDEHTDLNLLEWHLHVPAREKQVVNYEFSVEHPRSLRIIGLND